MKKLILIVLLITTIGASAQTKILNRTEIKRYYEVQELQLMSKTQLKVIYFERITTLLNIIPYLALTNNPKETLEEIGIPKTKENIDLFQKQEKTIISSIGNSLDFQKSIIPYADKENIIKAIVLFEEFLKNVKKFNE